VVSSYSLSVVACSVCVVLRLVDIVAKLGETRKEGAGYIVWQEVFDNDVKVLSLCLCMSPCYCKSRTVCACVYLSVCVSPYNSVGVVTALVSNSYREGKPGLGQVLQPVCWFRFGDRHFSCKNL